MLVNSVVDNVVTHIESVLGPWYAQASDALLESFMKTCSTIFHLDYKMQLDVRPLGICIIHACTCPVACIIAGDTTLYHQGLLAPFDKRNLGLTLIQFFGYVLYLKFQQV